MNATPSRKTPSAPEPEASPSAVDVSRVVIPITPLPPRRCERYAFTFVRLIRPLCVMVMITPSWAIRSSMAISPSSGTN